MSTRQETPHEINVRAGRAGGLAPRRRSAKTLSRKRKEKRDLFSRAYLRWLAKVSPEEARRMLRTGDPSGVTQEAKKALFLELYRDSWPRKVEALKTVGLSTYWLQESCRKDPYFAAAVLEIELNRVDVLKAYSYEQCFRPENVAERTLWLKKIDSEEFGDQPLVSLTNVIQNAPSQEGFAKLAALMKRREELLRLKEESQGAAPGTDDSGNS